MDLILFSFRFFSIFAFPFASINYWHLGNIQAGLLLILNILALLISFRKEFHTAVKILTKEKYRQKRRYFFLFSQILVTSYFLFPAIVFYGIGVLYGDFISSTWDKHVIFIIFNIIILFFSWYYFGRWVFSALYELSKNKIHEWNIWEIERAKKALKNEKKGPVSIECYLLNNQDIYTFYYGGHLNSGTWEVEQLAKTISKIGLKRKLLLPSLAKETDQVSLVSKSVSQEESFSAWESGSVLNQKVTKKLKNNREKIENAAKEKIRSDETKLEQLRNEGIVMFNDSIGELEKLPQALLNTIEDTIFKTIEKDSKSQTLEGLFPIKIENISKESLKKFLAGLFINRLPVDFPMSFERDKKKYYPTPSHGSNLFQVYLNLELIGRRHMPISSILAFHDMSIHDYSSIENSFVELLLINLLEKSPKYDELEQVLSNNNLYLEVEVNHSKVNFYLDFKKTESRLVNYRWIYRGFGTTRVQVSVDKPFYNVDITIDKLRILTQ